MTIEKKPRLIQASENAQIKNIYDIGGGISRDCPEYIEGILKERLNAGWTGKYNVGDGKLFTEYITTFLKESENTELNYKFLYTWTYGDYYGIHYRCCYVKPDYSDTCLVIQLKYNDWGNYTVQIKSVPENLA